MRTGGGERPFHGAPGPASGTPHPLARARVRIFAWGICVGCGVRCGYGAPADRKPARVGASLGGLQRQRRRPPSREGSRDCLERRVRPHTLARKAGGVG
jgi:hypothetical protein